MRIAQGSYLRFTTNHNECRALVTGPGNLESGVTIEDRLPTTKPGFYTLTVMDRYMRSVTATLEGQRGFATPQTESATSNEWVTLRYEVI